MGNSGVLIELQRAGRTLLKQRKSSHRTPQRVALRCRSILGALSGQNNVSLAEQLEVSRPLVQLWRKRMGEQGIGEVWRIAPERGRKPQHDQARRAAIINATLPSKPASMAHWSFRLMAQAQHVSKSTVNRLWQMHSIKPHLSTTFKLSRNRRFLALLNFKRVGRHGD